MRGANKRLKTTTFSLTGYKAQPVHVELKRAVNGRCRGVYGGYMGVFSGYMGGVGGCMAGEWKELSVYIGSV